MGRNGGRREDGGRISPHGGRENAGLTERVFVVRGMWDGDGEQGRREDGQNVGRLDRCREYSKREHNTVLCCLLHLKSYITQKNPYACDLTS